jgi:hypothetical protein
VLAGTNWYCFSSLSSFLVPWKAARTRIFNLRARRQNEGKAEKVCWGQLLRPGEADRPRTVGRRARAEACGRSRLMRAGVLVGLDRTVVHEIEETASVCCAEICDLAF